MMLSEEGNAGVGGGGRLAIQSQLLTHYDQPRCKSNNFSISSVFESYNIFSLSNLSLLYRTTQLNSKTARSHMLHDVHN
jgi:hypothetical protein